MDIQSLLGRLVDADAGESEPCVGVRARLWCGDVVDTCGVEERGHEFANEAI